MMTIYPETISLIFDTIEHMEKKWYKTKWGILIVIFFFPFFLLWLPSKYIWKKDWSLRKRIILIAVIWGLPIGIAGTQSYYEKNVVIDCKQPDGNTTKQTTIVCDAIRAAQMADARKATISATLTSAPTSTPKPVEKYNIVVTNQIVKKVDGKYRYFFDIRNHDTKEFEGSVSILLFTDELKNEIAGDAFDTKAPIEAELGASVYTDANTGPVSVHGIDGITKFKYIVRKDNQVVNSGEGRITDEFEDLDF